MDIDSSYLCFTIDEIKKLFPITKGSTLNEYLTCFVLSE